MDDKKRTQLRSIREHLESGRGITPLDALNLYGCFRLGARIWELRHTYGLDIKTNRVTHGNALFAEYTLNRPDEPQNAPSDETSHSVMGKLSQAVRKCLKSVRKR